MSRFELVMPKMGESIMEATILRWNKNVGDIVKLDENVLEIATDKVDSEVPSPVAGTIVEILYKKDDVVEVGKVIAIIETNAEANVNINTSQSEASNKVDKQLPEKVIEKQIENTKESLSVSNTGTRFYSPLVLNIAKSENISMSELEQIEGTGAEGRVTKRDIFEYIKVRSEKGNILPITQAKAENISIVNEIKPAINEAKPLPTGNVEIIEMDRMRKVIAEHMVRSKQTSPHVTSFVEVDVTNIVKWREKMKAEFELREKTKLTFTPIFLECITRAIKDFPMINSSVEGQNIIIKKDINLGVATALPSGNLIVPVIPKADQKNLVGITKAMNELVDKARKNQLKPEDIQGGTFTVSNVGTFGNVMGTPIINQPQVAILATGAIKKKPVVLETPQGDVIAIRQMMFLSLSYDHRIVDGALGGSCLSRIAKYMEEWDLNRMV
jgi:2-oxoglutarate dehydrogenase E2 component (dihydrolipoamide succinyltransferase)